MTKVDTANEYILKIQDESLRNYFMKGPFTMASFSLDKIKSQKTQIIEDALLIIRTNLAVVETNAKRQYFRLVEEIAGLNKAHTQNVLGSGTIQNTPLYSRNFSSTLLSPVCYNVGKPNKEIALTLMLWQQLAHTDSELKVLAEGFRQFVHTQFNQSSVHLVESISQLFGGDSLSFL